jgi:putative SOS response-associated peptidase YedK
MCARYTLTAEEKEILKENKYVLNGEYKPDPNIAISDYGFVVTSDEPDLVQRMRFGIIPEDSASAHVDFATFNIRSEEILDKPTFEPLIRFRKTCLIIADGFYEPETVTENDKRPWRFVTERKTFCFAGLWTHWTDPDTGEVINSYAILTCESNRTVEEKHKKGRMPVILPKVYEKMWLNKKLSVEELLSLCVPYPDHLMSCYRVSKKVNRPSTKLNPNKDMSLINPVEDEPRQQNIFGADLPKRSEPVEKPKTWNSQRAKKVQKPKDRPAEPGLFD